MKQLEFDWDAAKSKSNEKRHGISFEEAQSVFADPNARLISDPDHSDNEDRFVLLGMSERLRILVVCHCYREDDTHIRIISARRAKRKEIESYEEHLL
jgi:uncharacterized DUF497 family protein